MNRTAIKNHIQKHREAKGLDQQKLADEIGITRTYLSKLENQKFSPGPDLMAKVCSYFGKELGEMFYLAEGGEKDDQTSK